MTDTKAWKQTVGESALIVCAACVLGVCLNLLLPGGYAFMGKETLAYRKIVLISPAEAKLKYDGRTALFVDARDPAEFGGNRVPGALGIPAEPDSLSLQGIKLHFDRLQGPRELVIYCAGGSCESSETLARRLIRMGYTRTIYVLEGGLPAWVEKNFPLETAGERKEE
ncbi:MAG: rhodanese-like domain-containing protein [Spirochaetes bacterium]|nr:MAG: rhodanese-like domain-containing protein [Spirochaetota bacterium]